MADLQWLRKVSLVIATDSKALDLSALRLRFSVRQHDLQTTNNCTIRVWNVAEETAQGAKEFSRVVLSAGYENGSVGTIFDGTIIQTRRGREDAANTYLEIVAADGDKAYNFGVVSQSLAAGSTPAQQAAAAASAMEPHGVTVGYIGDLGSMKLPRGKVMFGMARDHLRCIANTTDSSWSIQNGQLQVLPINEYLPGEAVVLTSATGMVGIPEQTQGGIKVRCLLNSKLRMGGVLQIDNRSIQTMAENPSLQGQLDFLTLQQTVRVTEDGFYKVLVVEHSGDTRGNDWYSDIIAVALGDPVPQPTLARI